MSIYRKSIIIVTGLVQYHICLSVCLAGVGMFLCVCVHVWCVCMWVCSGNKVWEFVSEVIACGCPSLPLQRAQASAAFSPALRGRVQHARRTFSCNLIQTLCCAMFKMKSEIAFVFLDPALAGSGQCIDFDMFSISLLICCAVCFWIEKCLQCLYRGLSLFMQRAEIAFLEVTFFFFADQGSSAHVWPAW